jgi:hypothetical protein
MLGYKTTVARFFIGAKTAAISMEINGIPDATK